MDFRDLKSFSLQSKVVFLKKKKFALLASYFVLILVLWKAYIAHSHVLTFYTEVMTHLRLGSYPVEKQTGALEAPEFNQLSIGTSTSTKLAPGSSVGKGV